MPKSLLNSMLNNHFHASKSLKHAHRHQKGIFVQFRLESNGFVGYEHFLAVNVTTNHVFFCLNSIKNPFVNLELINTTQPE